MKPWMLAPLALVVAVPVLAAGPLMGARHHRGPIDAESVMERANRAMNKVDATDEQRESVRVIVEDTVPQMQAYRDEAGTLREEIRGIFHAETIDRNALELARTDLVDLVDRATATGFGALADLAEIFTVEQRQTLHEMHEKRHRARMDHGPGPR